MKKVLDKELEGLMYAIVDSEDEPEEKASMIIAQLRGLQDAAGLKMCMNRNKDDVAFEEVV